MKLTTILLLLCACGVCHGERRYRAHDGSLVRGPHTYKRHPNRDTVWRAVCRDGSISFSRSNRGACSRHGGVRSWH